MWHSLLSYITYWFRAKTKYRIHSPFVYHLVREVLEAKNPPQYRTALSAFRKALAQDENSINVTDFGAGSRVFNSTERPVKAIAKYAGISDTKALYLQKLVAHFKPKHILELGTSLGIASVAMSIAYPKALITSLEGCPNTAQKAQEYIARFHYSNIKIYVGEFAVQLPDILQKTHFDLIYFDGNHQKKPTLQYFEMCLAHAHKDSLFIFDDIHWSKEMEEAWHTIQTHPKTKVCIDLFHIGLVFFRTEQVAQNFSIKLQKR